MDPITAFLASITTSLGASGIALWHGYVSGIVINLLSGKLERDWEKRAQAQAEEQAELFQQIEQARPLREEFSRVAVNATRVAARHGLDQQASAVLGLLQDLGFQAEMGRWLLASNVDEEKAASAVVAKSLLQAFNPKEFSSAQIEEFIERFFAIANRFLLSNAHIVAWRAELRDRHTQDSLRIEAAMIREDIRQSKDAVLEALNLYLGPLVPTTADDVRRLRNTRDLQLTSVRSAGTIELDGQKVKIDRAVVLEVVRASQAGSLLLTGEPGSGKSLALTDAVIDLHRQGYDVLYLDVQRLSSESLGELKNELGLSFPIEQILADWPGRDAAILCIDGLDAARSAPASRMIRDLIQLAMGHERWKVVASIRKFDMRYALELKKRFAGEPLSSLFQDGEFKLLRHISVPLLSDDELASFAAKSPSLSTLISRAKAELLNQLRTPFNIWLASDVINSGAEVGLFAEIRTQLQLLELYWQHRVIRNDGYGNAREAIAFQAASQMVAQRELKTSRSSVAKDPAASQPLDDLLSSNVLSEWKPPGATSPSRYALAFPHNTLFDYVASLTLFEEDPDRLLDALKRDAALILFVLPSIRFFLQKLWDESPAHERFWSTTIAIAKETSLPEMCKVVGPSVATQLAQCTSDFDLVFSALQDKDPDKQRAAVDLAQHISGAAIADNSVAENHELWIEWTEKLTQHLDSPLASSANNLLWSFIHD